MYRNVIRRWKRDKHPTAQPLSNRAIVLGAVFVLGIAVASGTVLWCLYGGASDRVQLDAIRTASAITVAAGGAVALLLAARRQQSTELTLEHERENAAEQRITELYTRAVDQLGAEKAPVRLGGLHALERLAQNNPTQRQTIVDVICAYLRMPYTPPGQAPGEDAPEDAHIRYEQRRQELQVRLTAQRILSAHLNPEAAAVFWADIDLDLTNAHLHQFELIGCHVRTAQFFNAKFTGYTRFDGAKFTGDSNFIVTEFAAAATFDGAKFVGERIQFFGVKFAQTATFNKAEFAANASFENAKFTGGEFATAQFSEATFAREATFNKATFAGDATFKRATFAGDATFKRATFAGDARFDGATFAGNIKFGGDVAPLDWAEVAAVFGAEVAAVFRVGFPAHMEFRKNEPFLRTKFAGITTFYGTRLAPNSGRVLLPTGWITRAARPAEGEEEGWLYVVRDEESTEQPAEAPGDGSA